MDYSIENKNLRIVVNAKGAELKSIFHKKTETEYMWNGDPAFWAKHAPILFPVIGALKDNRYFFEGNPYELERHGFARTKTFELINKTENSLLFSLKTDAETLKIYPFYFELQIEYKLEDDTLQVGYIVKNPSQKDLYFSVGGHPAFRVPIFNGDNYNDYILTFNKTEDAGRWPVSPAGLIENESVPFFEGTNTIQLTKELFYGDAIVLKHLHSNSVTLTSVKNGKGIHFNFTGFPYLGIWAARNANFVCIEPWCGIADSVHSNQQLVNKEGINRLPPGNNFFRA